uniref:Peptidase M12B domain-containing protein n=1 Tax=Elaeophora elaphi TaxID=1147741 RepID=A0A0R3RX04_9BILA
MQLYARLYVNYEPLEKLFVVWSAIHFLRKMKSAGVAFEKEVPLFRNPKIQHDNSSFRYQIDILMVADYSIYTNFLDIVRGDEYSALSATKDYLYAIFEQVRSIYDGNGLFENIPVILNLASTMAIIREDDCPLAPFLNQTKLDNLENTTRMNGLDAVNYVQKWVADYSQWIPAHNHIIVLTRIDLLSAKGDSSTQGMAYVGAMCRVAESASVVEDIGGMATAVIAAHELAHSLGAFHDGAIEPDEKCGKNYLMSATLLGSDDEQKFFNTLKFSPCSIHQIQSFFANGTADCLLRSKSRERRLRRTSQHRQHRKPGELLVQQNQCKIAFGSHYSVCPKKEYLSKDPCRRLWCKNRQLRKTEPCETKLYLPLLDGTKCGSDKWCLGGNCIATNKEEEECVDLNSKMCLELSDKKLRKYCHSKQFRSICCITCSQFMQRKILTDS